MVNLIGCIYAKLFCSLIYCTFIHDIVFFNVLLYRIKITIHLVCSTELNARGEGSSHANSTDVHNHNID